MLGDHPSVLGGERGGDRHGTGEDLVLGGGLVGDAGGQGLGGGEALPGQRGLVQRPLGQAAGQRGVHGHGEGQAEVDLVDAPVAPVLAHHDPVVGDGEHGAAGEGVTVDGGDGGRRQRQHPSEQGVHLGDEARRPGALAHHPLEVQAVGEEPIRPGGDHRQRTVALGQVVVGLEQRPDRPPVEAVLAVVHPHDRHRVVPGHLDQLSHRRLPGGPLGPGAASLPPAGGSSVPPPRQPAARSRDDGGPPGKGPTR